MERGVDGQASRPRAEGSLHTGGFSCARGKKAASEELQLQFQ
jgi:hypothetical protein